jgi:iron complex transport system permease protein
MLLIGVIFNAFAGAMLMVLQALADAASVQRVLLRLMGSLAVDPTRPLLLPALVATAGVATLALVRYARSLDLLALGDDTARSLGVRPDRVRLVLFAALSLPIGAVVAVSGMIGFVGLIVPHGIRLALGPDHRLLLPASALAGAAFVVLADGIVRLLVTPLGTELPVGVVTAAVGGPVFVWLLRRRGQSAPTEGA